MTMETVLAPTLDIDKFSVIVADGGVRHFTRDDDLTLKLPDDGDKCDAVVLVKLRLNGLNTCEAIADYGWPTYNQDPVAVLDDALETLTVLRDQLAAARPLAEDAS